MQRDLVEQAMAGDRDAFSELARASFGRLYAIARLILRDQARAEDATQEALTAAWRRLPGLRDPDRFDRMAPPAAGQRVPSRGTPRPTARTHRDPRRPADDAGSVGGDRPGCRSRRSRPTRARLPTPRRGPANGARDALLPRVFARRCGGGPRCSTGDCPFAAPSCDRRDACRPRSRCSSSPVQPRTVGMTSPNASRDDFDRLMSQWMEADGRISESEDLIEHVIEHATATRQISRWLLPERWLPMQLTTRFQVAPRLAPALLIALLLVALVATIAIIGSRPRSRALRTGIQWPDRLPCRTARSTPPTRTVRTSVPLTVGSPVREHSRLVPRRNQVRVTSRRSAHKPGPTTRRRFG